MNFPAQRASQAPTGPSPEARVVLESRGLKKTYGRGSQNIPVLLDANLILREGEMVAVVAPSGAGKSTLLHLLAALDTPTSGTVYFDSKALETNDDAALDRKSTRLNSSHTVSSYAVFCLKKKH